MNQEPVAEDVSILPVGSRKFVTGLRWQNLVSSTRYMDEAREFGREHDMDIVAIRVDKTIQGGFVSRRHGVDRSMYSAASVLIDTLGESWFAAFALGDGRYYVVAADKNAIIPDGDFVADEATAMRWSRELLGQFGWKDELIIVPADWAMGGHEEPFEAVIARASVQRKHRLKSLLLGLAGEEWARLGYSALAAMALAGLAFYGWHLYTERERLAQEEAQRARAAEMARLSEAQARLLEKSSLTKPWTLKPSVSEFVDACEKAIYGLPMSIGGWLIDSAHCTATALHIEHKREVAATSIMFLDEFERLYPAGKATVDGGSARYVLEMSMGAGGDEYQQIPARWKDWFISHFQRIDHKLELSEIPSVSIQLDKLPDGSPWPKDLAAPVPTWDTYAFKFASVGRPSDLLAGLPWAGLRLESVDVRLDAGSAMLTWSTTGELYVPQ